MESSDAQITGNLDTLFSAYSHLGNLQSDGTTITLVQIQTWFHQAEVIGPKNKVSVKDTADIFNKFKSPFISYANFLKLLDDLANSKNISTDVIKHHLMTVTVPTFAVEPTQVINEISPLSSMSVENSPAITSSELPSLPVGTSENKGTETEKTTTGKKPKKEKKDSGN